MTDSINTRELVLDMLMEVTREGRPSHVVHSQMLIKYQYLQKNERSFMSRLFKGTIERMITLDYVIGCYSSVKVEKIKPVLKNIMRMAVYQMLYMKQVPVSAACNEAVKLAVKRGFKNLKGFVNGVLRNIGRNLDSIEWPSQEKQPYEYLSVTYSAPVWLVKFWCENYGVERTKMMLADSLESKPVTVRCIDEKNSEHVKAVLESEGVTVAPGAILPYALKLSGFDYLASLDSFCEGLYTVQDESSMMVVEMAGLKAGDTVIDVCAAPGGKSCHAAAKLKAAGLPYGHVYARDLTEEKAELIEENRMRLSLDNITVQVADATQLSEEDIGKAQVVLADLPCSGLGVLGKKADIKYRMSLEQMEELKQLQRQILSVVHQYVASGGTLIYSTCTVNPEENEKNALWFSQNFDFELVQQRQFFAGEDGCDGFFIARFQKINREK